MIKSVHVSGYQSLYDVEIELGRFTVIVGETDSGKSAFIRALTGWSQNQSGSGFISYGKTKTNVDVTFDNGDTVGWEKPKNRYVVNDKIYDKAGRDVPDEVRTTTGFIDVVFDEDYAEVINFAQQFDSPFMLTLPGTKVAKILGKLSGVEFLYNAQRLANKEVLTLRSTRTHSENQIVEYEAQLRFFDDLDNQRSELDKLKSLFEMARGIHSELIQTQTALDVAHDAQQDVSTLKMILDQLPSDLPDFTKIEEAWIALKERFFLVERMKDALLEIEMIRKEKVIVGRDLARAEAELDKFLKSFPVCPFCERPMDHEH